MNATLLLLQSGANWYLCCFLPHDEDHREDTGKMILTLGWHFVKRGLMAVEDV
jgi:hypothetical protein